MNKREQKQKKEEIKVIKGLPREMWQHSLRLMEVPENIIEIVLRNGRMVAAEEWLNSAVATSTCCAVTTAEAVTLPRLFGVEIECYNAKRDNIIAKCAAENLEMRDSPYNHRDEGFAKIVNDGSLRGNDTQEVVMPPLNCFTDLQKVCKALQNAGAKVNVSCGLHVHIDAREMSPQHALSIGRNYYYLRQIINKSLAPSRRANNYCHVVCPRRSLSDCDVTWDELTSQNASRYVAVNYQAYLRHKTLEFRQHHGTINFKKISNWVRFLESLVSWSETHALDADVSSKEDARLVGLRVDLLRTLRTSN